MLLMGSLDVYIYNRFILTFQIRYTCMVYMYIYIFYYQVKGRKGYGADGIKCEPIRNKIKVKVE